MISETRSKLPRLADLRASAKHLEKLANRARELQAREAPAEDRQPDGTEPDWQDRRDH